MTNQPTILEAILHQYRNWDTDQIRVTLDRQLREARDQTRSSNDRFIANVEAAKLARVLEHRTGQDA